MSNRETFLSRVGEAVRQGNQAGKASPLPDRKGVGYQGGRTDAVGRFSVMLQAAGGQFSQAADAQQAVANVLQHIERLAVRRVLLGCEPVLERLGLPKLLAERGCEVTLASELVSEQGRSKFFAADIAITGVDYLIAETGTMVMLAKPDQPRTASLLPPVHIAIAERSQILEDLFDLFERLDPKLMASCVTLITGPSKTGDIELKLVTGVHGPGEVHVILLD
ncbi:MAG TPA: lactate utilization protein [Gemmataceae bacterium]|jgi:L-lactate utilization protein LutC|nr:lactate utilization protein [Gemmataceae bacterium]